MSDTKSNDQGLDDYAAQNTPGYHYLISAAVPAGPSNYEQLHISDMNQYLDMWNLMAYDYSGSVCAFRLLFVSCRLALSVLMCSFVRLGGC